MSLDNINKPRPPPPPPSPPPPPNQAPPPIFLPGLPPFVRDVAPPVAVYLPTIVRVRQNYIGKLRKNTLIYISAPKIAIRYI